MQQDMFTARAERVSAGTRARAFAALAITTLAVITGLGSAAAQNSGRVVRGPEYGQVRLVYGQTLLALKPGTVNCPAGLAWEGTCLASAITQMRQSNLARASGFLPASETFDGAVRGEIIDIMLGDTDWSAEWRLEGAVGVFVPKQCAALPGETVRYTRGYEDRIDVIRESQLVVCNGAVPPKGPPWLPVGETIPGRAPPIGPALPPAWPVWPAANFPIVEGEVMGVVGIDPACPAELVLKDGLCFAGLPEKLAAQIAANPKNDEVVIAGSAQPMANGLRVKSIALYEYKQKKKGPSVSRKLFAALPVRAPADCSLVDSPEYLIEGADGRFQVRAVQNAACGGPPEAPKGFSLVEFYGYAFPVARRGNCGPEDRLLGGNLCFGAVKAWMQARGIDRLNAILLNGNPGTGTVLQNGKSQYEIARVTANADYTEFTAERRGLYTTGLKANNGCRTPAAGVTSGVILEPDGSAVYWEWKECPA